MENDINELEKALIEINSQINLVVQELKNIDNQKLALQNELIEKYKNINVNE
jgi:hypothetical protein